jgi:hypothetical protein
MFCVIVMLSLLSGCAYTPTRNFAYTPAPVLSDATQITHGVLVVKKLSEARGERTYPNSTGRLFKTYIPLLPNVSWSYERLDESDVMTQKERTNAVEEVSDFKVSVSKAIADDLKNTGLFKEVRYIGDQSIPADADLVLSGDLKGTALDTTYTSYCLGMVGVLLWILPIPLGRTTGHVEATLKLTEPNGKEVWSDQLTGKSKRTYTLYNSAGKAISSVFSLEIRRYGKNKEGVDGDSFWAYHASALRRGMVDVKRSLFQKMSASK